MIKQGMPVYAVAEDLEQRGIPPGDLVPGVTRVSQRELARLFDEHESIWHW